MAGPNRKPRLVSISAASSLFVSSTAASMSKNKKLREPVAVDALPLSSSSSSSSDGGREDAGGDDGQQKRQARKPGHASDSSASAGYSRRGDIGRTEFRPSAAPARNARQPGQTGVSHRAMDLRQRPTMKRSTATQNYDDDGSSASSRGSKRPRSTSTAAATATATATAKTPSANQLRSSQNSSQSSQASRADSQFTRSRRHPPRVGYSRQSSFASAGGRSNTGSFIKVRAHGSSDFEDEVGEPEIRSKFVQPRQLTPEAESPAKKFRHKKVSVSDDEDEKPAAQKAQFKWPAKSLARSPPQKTKKVLEKIHPDKPLGSTLESLKSRQKWRLRQRPAQAEGNGTLRTRRSRSDGTKKTLRRRAAGAKDNVDDEDDDDDEKHPKLAVFKMPAVYDADDSQADMGDVGDGQPISSDEHDSGDDSEGTIAYEPAVCPLCNVPVDEETLHTLLPPTRGGAVSRGSAASAGSVRLHLLKFDEKMNFCAAHRQRAAQKTWASRGYPDIDWGRLDGRIQKHCKHVQGVLEGTVSSHFRGVLQEQRGAGSGGGGAIRGSTNTSSKNTQRDDANAHSNNKNNGGSISSSSNSNSNNSNNRGAAASVPGYYGQRGLKIMSEAIVQRFSAVLRRQAVQDPLIAARGYLQFVQDVLVPELAVQLIMEDMKVEAEEARQILSESVAMGELIHEEDVDVITDGEGDEDDEYEEE